MRRFLVLLAIIVAGHACRLQAADPADGVPSPTAATTPAVTASPAAATKMADPAQSKAAEDAATARKPLRIHFDFTFWTIFVGAALATFVASVMADEQEKRLRNGTFGAVAGSSVGVFVALLSNDQLLVVSGFLGSGAGALLGWIVSLLLSLTAAFFPKFRTMLVYQTGGLTGVQKMLDLEENEPLKVALSEWGRTFARRVDWQRNEIGRIDKSPETNRFITVMVRAWLCSTVDLLGTLFHVAHRPEYKNRITLIVFGAQADGKVVGKHWISESGVLEEYNTEQLFDDQSIGYKVLIGHLHSPYFFNAASAKGAGQKRADESYRPFWTFRINSTVILAIDWPGDLKEDDKFLEITRNLYHQDICPKIAECLEHWSDPAKLYEEVGLPLALGTPATRAARPNVHAAPPVRPPDPRSPTAVIPAPEVGK